jgi:hypothetical protein
MLFYNSAIHLFSLDLNQAGLLLTINISIHFRITILPLLVLVFFIIALVLRFYPFKFFKLKKKNGLFGLLMLNCCSTLFVVKDFFFREPFCLFIFPAFFFACSLTVLPLFVSLWIRFFHGFLDFSREPTFFSSDSHIFDFLYFSQLKNKVKYQRYLSFKCF